MLKLLIFNVKRIKEKKMLISNTWNETSLLIRVCMLLKVVHTGDQDFIGGKVGYGACTWGLLLGYCHKLSFTQGRCTE